MARIPRMLVDGEPTAYHAISRTALSGFPLGDDEKGHLVQLIKRLRRLYFVEIPGFSVLGTHFRVLARMHPGSEYSDDVNWKRFHIYYGADTKRELFDGQIPAYRAKWESLSDLVGDLKQTFSKESR